MWCFADNIKNRRHNTKQVSVDFIIPPPSMAHSMRELIRAGYKESKLIVEHQRSGSRSPRACMDIRSQDVMTSPP